MKKIIQLEEFAMFGLSLYLFSQTGFAWWWFPALILAPDIGMLGYLWGARVGSHTYNLFHHKGIAAALMIAGWALPNEVMLLTGIILFGHASMDRAFGFGLKYKSGFKQTHLGTL